jgi:arylsulfatase A
MSLKSKQSFTWRALLILFVVLGLVSCATEKADPPNIILILADDLGYGDIQSCNPESEIPTPHLNRLFIEGIIFTDAHPPSLDFDPYVYVKDKELITL